MLRYVYLSSCPFDAIAKTHSPCRGERRNGVYVDKRARRGVWTLTRRAFESKPKVNTSSNLPRSRRRVSSRLERARCITSALRISNRKRSLARVTWRGAPRQRGSGWLTHRHVCWRRCWSWNRVSWGWTASWCWRDSSSGWTMVPEAERPVPGRHRRRSGSRRWDSSRRTAGAEPPIDPPPRRDAWWHLANSQLISSRSQP